MVVYPSHYGGSVCGRGLSGNPISSIGFERAHNPLLALADAGRVRRRAARRHAAPPAGAGADRRRQPRRAASARSHDRRSGSACARTPRQFALLVGAERPRRRAWSASSEASCRSSARRTSGSRSTAAILAFVVAFGAAKALTNLAAGELAERFGRKRLLVAGWLVALPVPLLIGLAPIWWFIVAANLLLGVNQGLAWSMTVVMKIDLAGPRRRGLALGLNEAAGYLGVAAAAFVTGALAASYAPRTVVWVGAALIASTGLLVSVARRPRHRRPRRARAARARRPGARARRTSAAAFAHASAAATRSCAPAARPGS